MAKRKQAPKSTAQKPSTEQSAAQKIFKAALPHIIVIISAFVFTALFFKPELMGNKKLVQGDIVQYEGMSREITDARNKGNKTLWINNMFSGMPTYAMTDQSEGSLALGIIAYSGHIMRIAFISLTISILSFYFMLLVLKVPIPLAAIGGLAYAINSFGIISVEAGHISKYNTMAMVPLLMAGVFLYFFRKRIWAAIGVTAIGMALMSAAGHYQIVYYTAIMVIIFGISELVIAVKNKKIVWFATGVGILTLAVGLGVAVNTNKLAMLNSYVPNSQRAQTKLPKPAGQEEKGDGLDKDYMFRWSMGKLETLTFLIPDFYGGSSSLEIEEGSETYKALKSRGALNQVGALPYYWGDQPFTSGPNYAGAVMLFLFVFGLALLSKRWRYWMIGTAILVVLLGWGKNLEGFNYAMADYFPLYNKFRTVTMSFYLIQFMLPLAGILGLFYFLKHAKDQEESILKKLYLSAGALGAICLIFILVPSIAGSFTGSSDSQLPEWLQGAIEEDRVSMLRSDAFRSLILIAIAAGALWLYLKQNMSKNLVIGVIGLLVVFDMWSVDARYLNENDYQKGDNEAQIRPDNADQQIMQDRANYRVLNLGNPFNESKTAYFHNAVGGYSPVKTRLYQDMIDRALGREVQELGAVLSGGKFTLDSMEKFEVLNMLNTKYIKYPGQQGQMGVFQNPKALGDAWFVGSVKTVDGQEATMEALKTFDVRNTVIMDKNLPLPSKTEFQAPSQNTIAVKERKPNKVTYSINAQNDALLVFSEVWFPAGWKVKIDGEEFDGEIFRANYILRSLEIPKGEHIVEMRFDPDIFNDTKKYSYLASLAVLILLGFSVSKEIKTKPSEEVEEEEIL